MTTGLRRLFLLLALVAVAGRAAADGDEKKAQAVRDALAAGRPVVVALAKELPGDEGDETDADWAFYLNEFSAGHRGYEIVAMSAAEAGDLLAEVPPLEEFYATIFARSATSAVIYDGAVLEPSVYAAGAAYLDAPQDGQFDAELFAPIELHLK
jgi:hypothetical protein